ncbi:hypothetical protein [Pseudidiomarina homiensis]|uniref:hypothetical protein n=1 Tax=Pseudidiomarina homiensis TaxID=364198 RepID=UPI00215B1C57|nr:hypothetical protein [Pseudidiomarina homiensis]
MKKLFALGIVLGLIGCSSAPEIGQFEPQAENNKVVVYHYRPWMLRSGAVNYIAASNNQPMTIIRNGTVFREVAEPGELVYLAEYYSPAGWGFLNPGGVLVTNLSESMEEKLRLDTEANKIYFVEWTPDGVRLTPDAEARAVIPELSWNKQSGWPEGEEERLKQAPAN